MRVDAKNQGFKTVAHATQWQELREDFFAVVQAIPSEPGLDRARRREVVKTSVRATLPGSYRQGKGVNGNRNQQNSLSTMEQGKLKFGAEILLRIGREVGKSIEWPLRG